MTGPEPLHDRLAHLLDLRIEGFLRAVPEGRVLQMALAPRSVQGWFDEFHAKIVAAMGHRFLPVFRVCDGEFYFAVGYRLPHPQPGRSRVAHYLKESLSYLKWRRFDTYRGGHAVHNETYRGAEWRTMRARYVEQLRQIADEGVLALGLFKMRERFAERYHRPVCDWLDANAIPVHEGNYYPFYFVYALLLGPRRRELLAGRRVLVVTSLTPEKQQAIERSLVEAGAASVQFIAISATKAMTDVVEPARVRGPIDLALVGGGVGAANILVQLRPLQTVCIDAGFCLDVLHDPRLAGARDFTRPDDPAAGAARG